MAGAVYPQDNTGELSAAAAPSSSSSSGFHHQLPDDDILERDQTVCGMECSFLASG
jgi:hypothetical protein